MKAFLRRNAPPLVILGTLIFVTVCTALMLPPKPRPQLQTPPPIKPLDTDHHSYCLRLAFTHARASSYCAGMQEVCNRFVVDRAFGDGHYHDLELCLDFAAKNCAPPHLLDDEELFKECPGFRPRKR